MTVTNWSQSVLEREAGGLRIALLLSQAQGAVAIALAAEGRQHNLGPSEVAALLALQSGPAPISGVARTVGIRPNGASVLVERLHARGLVTRTRSTRDSRVVRVELTVSGHDLAATLASAVDRRMTDILTVLAPSQREQLDRSPNRDHLLNLAGVAPEGSEHLLATDRSGTSRGIFSDALQNNVICDDYSLRGGALGTIRRALATGAQVGIAYAAYVGIAVLIHGILRSIADDANGSRSLSIRPAEELLMRGVPSAWAQELFGTEHPLVVEAAFELWFSLFWVTPVLAFVSLGLGGMRAFVRLLTVHAVVVYSADIIYAIAPTRPVWMDADVTRIIAVETDNATAFDSNAVASLPSLHVAVPVAYAMWFWRQQDARLQALGPFLAIWAAGVAGAVVYAGEHYVLCAVAGALLAIAANLVIERLCGRSLAPFGARGLRPTPLPPDFDFERGATPLPAGAGGR